MQRHWLRLLEGDKRHRSHLVVTPLQLCRAAADVNPGAGP